MARQALSLCVREESFIPSVLLEIKEIARIDGNPVSAGVLVVIPVVIESQMEWESLLHEILLISFLRLWTYDYSYACRFFCAVCG